MEKEQVVKHFKNPDPAFRGMPFWSWNGRLEKEELEKQHKESKRASKFLTGLNPQFAFLLII